ncbi:MAG: HAD domain-containing protein [Solirubrobacteraceae bacterium]
MKPPLLLIDIDGVISLFGFDHGHPPDGTFVAVDGIAHFLSTNAGAQLLELGNEFELVWCSGWEEKADEHLPLALGLPAGLEHVTFDLEDTGDGRHWKLASIDRYAGAQRALAWIDDDHDASCHAWAASRAAPTLLITTRPEVGLTPAHTAELTAWARALAAARGTRLPADRGRGEA